MKAPLIEKRAAR